MKVNKFISALMICSIVSSSTLAFADEAVPTQPAKQSAASQLIPESPAPVPGEPDVGAAISPMKKGQIAAFTGVLLSPKAIATIIAELDSIEAKIKIEVDKVKGDAVANCTFGIAETQATLGADKRVLQSKLDDRIRQNQALEDQLKKQESATSSSPALWGGLGFGVGVAVTVLTSVIIVRSSK